MDCPLDFLAYLLESTAIVLKGDIKLLPFVQRLNCCDALIWNTMVVNTITAGAQRNEGQGQPVDIQTAPAAQAVMKGAAGCVMEHLNAGHLQPGLLAFAFGGLQP